MKTVVVLTCDDRFVPYTAVVARQIARHAVESFPILVVSDGVTAENKALARTFCPRIEFIEAQQLLENRSFAVSDSLPRAAYLRLFLDEILTDFDRAVYLDSDISLLTDISPLLAMTPTAAPIIAGYDLTRAPTLENNSRLGMSKDAAYFNSGVIVYDLRAIRREGILADARQYAVENADRCQYADQDAQNAVLDGRWQVLDWRWNAQNYMSDRMPKLPFIRHFAGDKPWSRSKTGVQARFVREWRSELAASPWQGYFNEKSLKYRLRSVFRPAAASIEFMAKSLIYARSPGRTGTKIRFMRNHATMLSSIEQAAAAKVLATPLLQFGRIKD